MNDHDGNTSNPYKPNPEHCCEACVFGDWRTIHAEWCVVPEQLRAEYRRLDAIEREAGRPYFYPAPGPCN